MLHYIHGNDLDRFPKLKASMFRDRAHQFRDRLRWDVRVDAQGWERDEYDALNPLYVIWERPDGTHGGSLRFLPTTGRTMIRDHFRHLIPNVDIASPLIWECTRFCLAPGVDCRVAAALMLGGGELMRAFSLSHFVGVFAAPMARIYRRIGSSPEVLGTTGKGAEAISVGLWAYSQAARGRVLQQAGLSSALSDAWFEMSMGSQQAYSLTA